MYTEVHVYPVQSKHVYGSLTMYVTIESTAFLIHGGMPDFDFMIEYDPIKASGMSNQRQQIPTSIVYGFHS